MIPGASSARRAWSATGFISMLLYGVAGIRLGPDSICFEPYLPKNMDYLEIKGLRYRESKIDISIKRKTGDFNAPATIFTLHQGDAKGEVSVNLLV